MKWIDRFVCGKSISCRAALMVLFLTKYQRHAKGSLSPRFQDISVPRQLLQRISCVLTHVFWLQIFFGGGIFSKNLCDINWWILKTNLVFYEMCQIGEQDKIGNRCRARKCRVCPQSIPQLHSRLPQQASTGTRVLPQLTLVTCTLNMSNLIW